MSDPTPPGHAQEPMPMKNQPQPLSLEYARNNKHARNKQESTAA